MPLRLSTGLRNKILGLSTGVEVNGTFEANTNGWTAADATLDNPSGGQSGNCLEIAESGGVNPGQAYQDVTTLAGRIYKLSVYFKKGTADAGRVLIGSAGDPDAILDSGALSDADWALKTYLFTATAASTRITLQTDDATVGETSLFDELVLNEVLDGVQEIMRGCKIAIYTGTQPASADDAATGTLLCTISLNGGSDGLSWGNASNGVLSKSASETWQGTAVATNTAGWFRCYQHGDNPANASSTLARFDGAVSTTGAQLNMSSTSIVSGAVQTVSAFTITQPGG